MTELNYIVTFDQPATLETVGGKGLNLMRQAQAALPVPPGFIVSTAAYMAFVRFNHLEAHLSAALAALGPGQPLADISTQVCRAFGGGEFPPELTGRITQAYREIGKNAGRTDLPVAARSSATAEDLAEASFAGQQDTYLNVHGETGVLAAVRRCWGSLWSERAIDYRARQGSAPLSARLAVVVQEMIFAQAAGVAFTADPFSGDSNQMVLAAAYGLGEAIVSGLVTPDHIAVDKRSGAVVSYAVSEKTKLIVSTDQGTREQPVPRLKQRARVLGKQQIGALLRLGLAIGKIYQRSQDLEWCLADGRIYIVQAHPITTLPELPLTWDAPGDGQWLHGSGTFEMITEPISPLFETFLFPVLYRAVIRMLTDIGLEDALPEIPYRVVNGFIYLHMQLRLRPWHLTGVLKDFALHLNSMKEQASEQILYREAVAALCQGEITKLTSEQLLARLHSLGEAGLGYWLQIMKLVQVIYRQEKAFSDFYNRRARRTDDPELEIYLRGQKIKPWEAECSTLSLAQLARKLNLADRLALNPAEILTGPASREWHAALEAHLERFGRQLSSFDLALPTLADDPRPVLTAIQSYLNRKESPYARQERMAAEREQAAAMVLNRLSPRDKDRFARLLERAQQAARTREDALFDVGLAWTPMRRIALELGSRLTQLGVIAEAGDVFWLHLDEIRAVLEEPGPSGSLTRLVAERASQNRSWSKVSAPYLLPIGSQAAFWWK